MSSVSAPDLVRLRSTINAFLPRLVVYAPPAILTGRVSATWSQGAQSIAVPGATVLRTPGTDYQVLIGTAAGARDLGVARYRSYSGGVLGLAPNNAFCDDQAYVTILEEIKPTEKSITINDSDVVFEDGDLAYSNQQNVNYSPLARCGTHAVLYRDPDTGLATGKFFDQGSEAFATGATIASCVWSWRGGTVVTGSTTTPGSAGSPNVVTWDTAGDYYCSYSVLDSNGVSHTRYFVVFGRDRLSGMLPYTKLAITDLSFDSGGGSGTSGQSGVGLWKATINVMTSAGAAAFPDHALCVVFAEDWYGSEQVSIGPELYRENVVMVGYIRTGTTKQSWDKSSVEFELESVSGVMTNLADLAGGLVSTAGTPGGWHDLQNMTYNRAALHVLTRHSTIAAIADAWLNLPDYSISYVDLQDTVLSDQLNKNCCTPVRSRLGCSPAGALYLEVNPQLIPKADRSSDYVISTTNADLRDELDLGTEQEQQTSQVDFSGDDANADPVFSLAPAVPWPEGQPQSLVGIRVADQAESNEFAGLFEGYANNVFADVVLNWRGNYRIFRGFPAEPIAVNIDPTKNARAIEWIQQRCWIKGVVYDCSKPGILLVQTTVEKDSYGSPGITGDYPTTPPTTTIVTPTPLPPEPPTPTPPPPTPPEVPGKGNLLYLPTHQGLAKCVGAWGTNGSDGSPVWTNLSAGWTTDQKYIRFFNLDPASASGDHFTAGWAMTHAGLVRVTGLPGLATPTLQLTADQAGALLGYSAGQCCLGKYFTPSVRQAGFIAAIAVGPWHYGALMSWDGYPIFVVWSTDYGVTWHGNNVYWEAYGASSGFQQAVADAIVPVASQHLDDTLYLITDGSAGIISGGWVANNAGGIPTPDWAVIFKSSSPGVWALAASMNQSDWNSDWGGLRWFPYSDAAGHVYADDQRSYFLAPRLYSGGGTAQIQRMTSTFTPPWTPGYTPPRSVHVGDAAMSGQAQIHLATNMFNEDAGVAIDPWNIWLTQNLTGSPPTWVRKQNPSINGRVLSPTHVFCVPADKNIAFFAAWRDRGGAGIAMPCLTPDGGTTLIDISQYGTGGALDTVMGLGTDDCDESIIFVDYYKT